MNRQIIVLVFVFFLVVTGIVLYVASRPDPAAVRTTPVASSREPAVAPRPAPPAPPVDAPPPRRRAMVSPRVTSPVPGPEPSAPPADRVTLRVNSDVPGAQVFIDRQFVGAAPVSTTEVKPGTHQINVSAPGYDPYAESIELAPGPRDVVVRFKEVRLAARADVIHKHGIGSCRGTLVATPQGLRYDTTNEGDAFVVPLTNLEAFDVNYLEKNLRVKIKSGKQYNFTDPAGNADNLFVFQRDVDKARQRLLKGDQPATD